MTEALSYLMGDDVAGRHTGEIVREDKSHLGFWGKLFEKCTSGSLHKDMWEERDLILAAAKVSPAEQP